MTLHVSADWGGTSFRAACISSDGSRSYCNFSAANIRSISAAKLSDLTQGLCQIIGAETDKIRWLIGAAGGSDINAAKKIETAFLAISPPGSSCEIFPDFVCNHASSLGGKDGIILVNGTGSLIYADINDQQQRKGGWGFLLDETPSGAYFGKLVLKSVLEYLEGDQSRHGIHQMFSQNFPATSRAMILDHLYGSANMQNHLGSFSKVLTSCYDSGEELSRDLINRSFEKLGDDCERLMTDFSCQENVYISGCGGLWDKWASFYHLVDKLLHIRNLKVTLIKPEYRSTFGPLLHVGKSDKSVEKIFLSIPDKEKKYERN